MPEHWHIWRRTLDGRGYFVLRGAYKVRASAQRRAAREAIGRRCMILRCDGSPVRKRNGSVKTTITTAGLALCMALVIACQETAPKMEAPPEVAEPPEVVEPTLHGTWTMTRDWKEEVEGEDQIVGTRTHVLTFTKDRWIEYERKMLVGQTTYHDEHAESGTWTDSDPGSTVIKTWIDEGQEKAVAKAYRLTNSSLFVHPWRDGDLEDNKFEKYERVTDLPEIVGT